VEGSSDSGSSLSERLKAGNSDVPRPRSSPPTGRQSVRRRHWEKAALGHILARRLLKPDFGILVACRPAIKSAFWNRWEPAVLGQILALGLSGAALKGACLVGNFPPLGFVVWDWKSCEACSS
jgi:hypothetical protein